MGLSDPLMGDPSGLFERMVAEGQAAFSLACASDGLTIDTDRERQLVEAAITAGVVGALSHLRGDGASPHDEDPRPSATD